MVLKDSIIDMKASNLIDNSADTVAHLSRIKALHMEVSEFLKVAADSTHLPFSREALKELLCFAGKGLLGSVDAATMQILNGCLSSSSWPVGMRQPEPPPGHHWLKFASDDDQIWWYYQGPLGNWWCQDVDKILAPYIEDDQVFVPTEALIRLNFRMFATIAKTMSTAFKMQTIGNTSSSGSSSSNSDARAVLDSADAQRAASGAPPVNMHTSTDLAQMSGSHAVSGGEAQSAQDVKSARFDVDWDSLVFTLQDDDFAPAKMCAESASASTQLAASGARPVNMHASTDLTQPSGSHAASGGQSGPVPDMKSTCLNVVWDSSVFTLQGNDSTPSEMCARCSSQPKDSPPLTVLGGNSAASSSFNSVTEQAAVWEYRNGNSWLPFLPEDSAAVDLSWRQWKASSNPQDGGSSIQVSIGNALYEISFQNLTQTNLDTQKVRNLRRRELHRDGKKNPGPGSSAQSSTFPPVDESALVRLQRDLDAQKARAEAAERRAQTAEAHASANSERALVRLQRDWDWVCGRLQRDLDAQKARAEVAERRAQTAEAHASANRETELVRLQQDLDAQTARAEDAERRAQTAEAHSSANRESALARLQQGLDAQKACAEAAERRAQSAECESAMHEFNRKKGELRSKLATMHLHKELEVWKNQLSGQVVLHPRPHLNDHVQSALQSVPDSHYGKCDVMRRVVVTEVQGVMNINLWNKYLVTRKQILESLRTRHQCPWVDKIAPGTLTLKNLFLDFIHLEKGANEVLLFHGTTEQTAQAIVREGFDDRLNSRAMYGNGIYFSTDPCKARQYCEPGQTGCIIIARVVLGHPFEAAGPMPTHKRPPMVENCGVPHDSTIVRPGIPGRRGERQTHWEFVVQREQVYPELVVHFKDAT